MLVVALALELALLDVLGNDVIVKAGRDSRVERLCMSDESSHHVSIDGLVCSLFTARRYQILVDRGDVLCQHHILLVICLVEEQEDEVETGQESLWQIDVLIWAFSLVVPTIDRVGCCKD